VKPEPSLQATNFPSAGPIYTAAPSNAEVREEWDTPGFRLLVFLFKLALLLYVLAGAVLVALYFLKKRKEQEADSGGPL
jgi:hypothetical protein